MAVERGETTAGNEAKAGKPHKFLGSLRDALMAAGRDDTTPAGSAARAQPPNAAPKPETKGGDAPALPKPEILSAEEAAKLARIGPGPKLPERFGLPKES